jgi:hypothetical protein
MLLNNEVVVDHFTLYCRENPLQAILAGRAIELAFYSCEKYRPM